MNNRILGLLILLTVLLFLTGCVSSEENIKTELDGLSGEELNAVVEESGIENEAVAGMALYNKYAQKNVLSIAKSMQQAKDNCVEWVCDEMGQKKICKNTGYSISCGAGKECISGNCIPALANPCGNKYINPSEDCDDGGQSNNDGCSQTCKFEICGDGIIQTNSWASFKQGKVTIPAHAGEFCDEGMSNGKPNKCNKECSGITAPVCGNKVVESGEVCDDGNNNKGDGCVNCKIEGGWECEKEVCKLCAISLKGLTHWWPADGDAKDLKGGVNGNAGSGTTFSSGKLGKAFNFNAVKNGYVYVPDADSLEFGTHADSSIELWVKASTPGKILSKMGGTPGNPNLMAGYELILEEGSGQFQFTLMQSSVKLTAGTKAGTLISQEDKFFDKWHHVIVVYHPVTPDGVYCPNPTYNNPGIIIYVDGVRETSKAVAPISACLVTANDGGLYIGPGKGQDSKSFKGQIDEVGIYNFALSEKQIKDLYEAEAAGKKRCKNS
ncbi:MAG: LamG-like jellyroll fold domain-containing protein [Nanoarchaeota archaeon]